MPDEDNNFCFREWGRHEKPKNSVIRYKLPSKQFLGNQRKGKKTFLGISASCSLIKKSFLVPLWLRQIKYYYRLGTFRFFPVYKLAAHKNKLNLEGSKR